MISWNRYMPQPCRDSGFSVGVATLRTYVKLHDEWRDIATWIHSLHEDAGTRIYRWSWFQLYMDYFLRSGHEGPWYDRKSLCWKSSTTMPGKPNFVRRSRWLTSYIRKLAHHLNISLPVVYAKPDSPLIAYWMNLLPVMVMTERNQAVNTWMGKWHNQYLVSKDLAIIP